MAFATFLVLRLQTGACGVSACGFWRYRMPPVSSQYWAYLAGFNVAVWLLHNMLIVGSLYWELFETRQRVRNTNVIRNLHINIRPDWNMAADVEMLGNEANAAKADAGEANAGVQLDENVPTVPSRPLIPDLLSDPSSELAQTLRELK